METLESSRVCRLCGKQSGISINIFDKNENHVKKINAVLPIMVHEMDLLPKHMCHRCSYKLEEFHKFYVDCLRTDADLKSQLSWMRKEDSKERIGVPMVHIENLKIKTEPPDYDIYELDPIVENANYINSMSSVTFPVNGVQGNGIHEGIAYATYARCTCCCDKTDQSNRTLSNDYEKSVSRCSRVNEGETHNLGSSKLQAVKRNLLEEDGFQDRRTTVRSCLDTSKDIRRCRPMEMRDTSTNLGNIDGAKIKSLRPREVDVRSTIVRNLRPRKGSVDYVGTRKKSNGPSGSNISSRSRSTMESKVPLLSSPKFELPQIKVEVNDFEGRILRPRKGTIDYIGPKRKYMRSIDKEQRSQGEDYYAKRHKARNIGSKTKMASSKISELFAENGIKLAIKQEMLDFEDTVLDGSMSTTSLLPKNHRRTTGAGSLDDDDDPSEGVDPLPNNLLLNVQNSIANYSVRATRAQLSSNFHVTDKLKALTSMTKSRLKSDKIGLNRIEAIAYSPKYLRSQDAYLRSGRVKKFNDAERSARKLRKNLRNFAEKTRSTGKSLMKAIKGTVGTKKVPASIKLIDNNIKHYCEKCDVSFANKELYKLHACYD